MPPAPPDLLDAAEREAFVRLAKRQLRRARRALRGALPVAARVERSRAIADRLSALPEVQTARGVALFHPMEERGEVDLRGFHDVLRARGVRVYYPTSREGAPALVRVDELSELSEQGQGYLEPSPEAALAEPGAVDVVVVPALAVSESGHRLGYGAGFYDALLPAIAPPALSVVVAFDFELLAELPVDAWDVPCAVVVTDRREIRPAR
ncbi:MAG TPA: 5-formyltetrahydrofolate cyclo-ligase [Polyangiaceae bacterium]|nr:5-formyltetrahydrofolate cyclo-ligase [Polyangiaceae bacterium]